MTPDLLCLVRDDGKLYVERDSTVYDRPLAIRMWWPVDRLTRSPWILSDCDDLVGLALKAQPTSSTGPDYLVAGTAVDVWLPESGKTKAVRRWEADVPPPRNAVVMGPGAAYPGIVSWVGGQWMKEGGRTRKALPVRWDRLDWEEVPVE